MTAVLLRGLPLAQVGPEAARAQAAGFDGVGVTETVGNPFLAAAMAVRDTTQARIETAIALAFVRSPMDLAYSGWDLQALSGGRFALGLGTQVRAHVERRYGMPFERPAARMASVVGALRAIWRSWSTGARLDYETPFTQHTLMPENFVPQPLPDGVAPPPVLLAAVRERMLEVTGEVADGLIAHSFQTPEVLREVTLPALARGAEKAGRDLGADGFEITLAPFVATDDEGWEGARRRVAFYGSTPGYRAVLDHHDLGGLFEALHAKSRAGEWSSMPALVDDDVVGLFTTRADDADRLAVRLRERYGTEARLALNAEAGDVDELGAVARALAARTSGH